MSEEPEGIIFRVANYKKISNNKINTLCVAHNRKMIGNFF